jgi:hypothetical protein
MTKRRSPDPVEVYQLGHWEQMQLALALGWVESVASDDRKIMTAEEYKRLWGLIDPEFLKSIVHLFQAGNTTVLKHNNP